MVPSNCIQSIIHYSQSVDCSFCVHVLFSGPDVHHRVIAVQPGDIFSIVNTSCKASTHQFININKDIELQQEFSSLVLGFCSLFNFYGGFGLVFLSYSRNYSRHWPEIYILPLWTAPAWAARGWGSEDT